jgi:hypothetical protein
MSARAAYALAIAVAFGGIFLGAERVNAMPPQATQPAPAAISAAQTGATSGHLTSGTELLLVRDVDGEFAKAVRPIPAGKKGFKVVLGKPIDPQDLSDALRLYGTTADPGDTVQITGLDFHSREIRVEINGGGKKHFNWRQHLQIGVGNMSTPSPDPQAVNRPAGGVLVLDFGRDVPNLSPDDLKHDLALFLDFSKHSAATNWVDSLPPPIRKAIETHHAIVGMDHEMVLAALGRPDKKVRQWDDQGRETEDWIYGLPPSPSTFVTFMGETVIRVKEYATDSASVDSH